MPHTKAHLVPGVRGRNIGTWPCFMEPLLFCTRPVIIFISSSMVVLGGQEAPLWCLLFFHGKKTLLCPRICLV